MSKGIYVGVPTSISLSNLISEGSFENRITGWESLYTDINITTDTEGYINNCAKFNVIANPQYPNNNMVLYYFNNTTIFIEGHVYYASCMCKASTATNIGILVNDINNTSRYWLLYDSKKTVNDSWTLLSGRGTAQATNTTANKPYIGVSFESVTASQSIYLDEVQLFDLTAMFGAGNEPSKAWCDTNLLPASSMNSARKVKSIYVGVSNDEMIQPLTNLLTNGNFNNNLDNWELTTGNINDYSIITEDNEKEFKFKGVSRTSYGGLLKSGSISVVTTHVYYARAFIKCEVPYIGSNYFGLDLINISNSSETQSISATSRWQLISCIATVTSTSNTTTQFSLSAQTSGTDYNYIKNMALYDLTEHFGAGNEPTRAWCDANISEEGTIIIPKKENVARKVKKGYIGVNGVAKQFYTSTEIIPFTSSIIPTGWVASTGANQYTSQSECINKYGTWTASLIGTKDAYVTGPNDVINATTYFVGGLFNNQDADTIYLKLHGLSSALSYVELVLPNNIYIKPSAIYLVANTYTKLFVILGFNPETNTWETLLGDDTGTNTLWYTGSAANITTKNISTSNFYSRFRFGFARYNNSRTYAQPTMIKITSGELKIE